MQMEARAKACVAIASLMWGVPQPTLEGCRSGVRAESRRTRNHFDQLRVPLARSASGLRMGL